MARRPNHLHPQPRLHKESGHARVRIAGEEFWLGPCGCRAASAEYDRLIGEWLASGRSRPPSRRPKAASIDSSATHTSTPEIDASPTPPAAYVAGLDDTASGAFPAAQRQPEVPPVISLAVASR